MFGGLFADLGFWVIVLTFAGIYSVFALGLQFQVGTAGLLNFGHVGYMAIGAYTVGISLERGASLPMAMLLAVLAAVAAAIIIGLATLRLRADFLAITAIAFAEIIRLIALNETEITGGPRGINAGGEFRSEVVRPILRTARANDIDLDPALPLLLISWAVVFVVWGVLHYLASTPWGRLVRAVREDEDAARALGRNAFLVKLQALAIGAAVSGMSGMLYGFFLVTVGPRSFEPIVTFIGFVIVILAGLGSFAGVLVATIIVNALLEGSRYLDTPLSNPQEAALRFMIVGLALMLLVAFRPQGLLGKKREMVLGE